jgi:hypothetical protein
VSVPLGDTTTVPKTYADLQGTVPASAAPTAIPASPPLADNSTNLATTAWVKGQGFGQGNSAVTSIFGRVGVVVAVSGDYSVVQVTGAAPLTSPAFTGTPTAPTPVLSDNSTLIATTAWVKGQNYGAGGGVSFSDAEIPSGAINGVNTTYTLLHTPNPAASLLLFYNGVLEPNYTLTTNTITMKFTLQIGDTLVTYYRF